MTKHDYLYLIWKNPNTRRNYIVGKLEKNAIGYSFEYSNEYELALEAGWRKLEAFPDDIKYSSNSLFTTFASRLPDKKRRNINEVLNKYGLEKYDGYELLRKSGGRLPIDTYEFIDPIFPDDEIVNRELYVVGVRHLSKCKGEKCEERPRLALGDNLMLQLEPDNEHDNNAVIVSNILNEKIGYIPRYYSESVAKRLIAKISYECRVIEISDVASCDACIKVLLKMPKQ